MKPIKILLVVWLALCSALATAAGSVNQTELQDLIKNGDVYQAQMEFSAVTATTGTVTVGVFTGSRPLVVIAKEIGSTGNKLAVELYEVSWSGGVAVIPQNLNQVIGGQGPASLATAPTATLNSYIFRDWSAATGGGNTRVGQDTEAVNLILKPSTRYVIRILNLGAQSADMYLRLAYRNLQVQE